MFEGVLVAELASRRAADLAMASSTWASAAGESAPSKNLKSAVLKLKAPSA